MVHTTPQRIGLLLAGLWLIGLVAAPARAQNGDRSAATIRAMMEQRDRDIKRDLKPLINNPKGATAAQRERVEDLINDVIDFEVMGRLALGPFWNDLTDAQRTEFVEVFSEIVRAQSLADLGIYNAKVTYGAIRVVGDSAYVETTTAYKDKQTGVDYVLGYRRNAWHVDDIILDEVSTVAGYAKSFQTVIRKKGFATLMKSLNKKLAKLQGSS